MKLPIKVRWQDEHGKTFYSKFGFAYDGFGLTTTPAYHGVVDKKSVAQFLGYDRNGKEIYSDDAIRVYDSDRYPLTENGIEDAEDFFKISDIGKTFDNVVLLEE